MTYKEFMEIINLIQELRSAEFRNGMYMGLGDYEKASNYDPSPIFRQLLDKLNVYKNRRYIDD